MNNTDIKLIARYGLLNFSINPTTNSLIPIVVGAGVGGLGGYLLDRHLQDKEDENGEKKKKSNLQTALTVLGSSAVGGFAGNYINKKFGSNSSTSENYYNHENQYRRNSNKPLSDKEIYERGKNRVEKDLNKIKKFEDKNSPDNYEDSYINNFYEENSSNVNDYERRKALEKYNGTYPKNNSFEPTLYYNPSLSSTEYKNLSNDQIYRYLTWGINPYTGVKFNESDRGYQELLEEYNRRTK